MQLHDSKAVWVKKALMLLLQLGLLFATLPPPPRYICSTFSRPPRPSCFPIFSSSVFLFSLSAGIVTSTSQPLSSAPVSFRCLSAWNFLTESRVWLWDFWAVLLCRYPRHSVTALTCTLSLFCPIKETWTRRTSLFCSRLFDPLLIFFFRRQWPVPGQSRFWERHGTHPHLKPRRVYELMIFLSFVSTFFSPSRYCSVLSGLLIDSLCLCSLVQERRHAWVHRFYFVSICCFLAGESNKLSYSSSLFASQRARPNIQHFKPGNEAVWLRMRCLFSSMMAPPTGCNLDSSFIIGYHSNLKVPLYTHSDL